MPLDRLSTAASTTNQPPKASSRASRTRSAGLPAAPAPVAEHQQREREQAGEREGHEPRALVAEAAAEQPERPGRAAEGDRVARAAVGQQFGLFRRFGRGVRLRRFARLFSHRRDLARDAAGADRYLAGPAGLPADAAEAVVAERQSELGVVGGAADDTAAGTSAWLPRRPSSRTKRPPSPGRLPATATGDARSVRARTAARPARCRARRDMRPASWC